MISGHFFELHSSCNILSSRLPSREPKFSSDFTFSSFDSVVDKNLTANLISGFVQNSMHRCSGKMAVAEDPNFEEEFYRALLLDETKKLKDLNPEMQEFVPKPGYVIKLRNNKKEKVFINVCTSEKIPAPREISDKELMDILESVDATQYRVPMSIGEAHVELDNKGQGGCSLRQCMHVDCWLSLYSCTILGFQTWNKFG